MAKKKDLDWEALVQTTNANEAAERGRLNTSLKAIRIAWESEGGRPEDLPQEIMLRADAYRQVWPGIALTPTALAVHWKRVAAERSLMVRDARSIVDEIRKEEQ